MSRVYEALRKSQFALASTPVKASKSKPLGKSYTRKHPYRKVINALARHLAGLEHRPIDVGSIYDPHLQLAHQLIMAGDRRGMADIEHVGGEIALLLEDIQLQANKLRKTRIDAGKLVKELFGQDAVMVAPDNFAGTYPNIPQKICGSWCKAEAHYTHRSHQQTWTLKKAEARRWRPKQLENGAILPACPHCYHDRVWRFCQQIEQEFNQWGELSYSIVPKDQVKKLVSNIRNWRRPTTKKGGKGLQISYLIMPHDAGIVIIHNQRKTFTDSKLVTDTKPIPQDRPTLYGLVHQWANTPLGAKQSSSRDFGGDYKGIKGNGAKDKDKPKKEEEESEALKMVKVHFDHMKKLQFAMIKAGVEIGKDRTFKLSTRKLLQIAEEAGIVWQILAGEGYLIEAGILDKLGRLTLKVHTESNQENNVPKASTNKPPGLFDEVAGNPSGGAR